MAKRKLGICTQDIGAAPFHTQLERIKRAGFDCFFSMDAGINEAYLQADEAARLGLEFETIHALFSGANDFWEDTPAGEDSYRYLSGVIDECKEACVKICVMHVTVGNFAPPVTDFGLSRWRRLCDYARNKGIKIAFENLEIPGHLDAVLSEITDFHGFCWDIGHNSCYTPGADMAAAYGGRLICTHIHDNFGVTGSEITFHDDLHLLPFDGGIDFEKQMEKLSKTPFEGSLMLEVSRLKAGDPRYTALSEEEYLALSFERAKKLRELCEKYDKNK